MKVFGVYCHPSKTSFTYRVYEHFLQGVEDAGPEIAVSD